MKGADAAPAGGTDVRTNAVTDGMTDNEVSVEQNAGILDSPAVQPANPAPKTSPSIYARVPDAAPDPRHPFRVPVNPFKPRRMFR